MRASVVGLGTWAMGGGRVWGADPDDQESIGAIQAAVDCGVNLIDTAPVYGWGRAERLVGQAIRERRERVIIATKCGLWWEDRRGSYWGPFDGKRLFRCLQPDTIQIEVENSLRRLGVECIDLYQVHWPSIPPRQTPIEETMACLMQLKQQGKVRAIGVSNVSPDELRAVIAAGELTTNQPRYNVLNRQVEAEIVPLCREHRVAILGYMTLEHGLLTGRVGVERQFQADDWRNNPDWNPWFLPQNRVRVVQMLAGWRDLTEKYRCTLAQLAIAWSLAQPGLTVALCGARRADQAIENAAAADVTLDGDDLARISRDAQSLGEPA
jgi:aryl-alcohol dehydrogenase-like predicted oxidoreductase